jgi:competence protein ComEC
MWVRRSLPRISKREGIRTLDAILLSHPHDDHIGGCVSLLHAITVGAVIVADTSPATKSYAELLEAARSEGIPIQMVRAGQRLQFDPSTRIFVLYPGVALEEGDLNNQSLVLKICYGKTSMILTGDAGLEVENQIQLKCGTLLASDVLKVAHHGASTSSGERFLRSVRPSMAVISVGRLNKFKHPSPVVLSRYRNLGIPTTRTDLDGAVILRSNGMSFSVVPWRRSGML